MIVLLLSVIACRAILLLQLAPNHDTICCIASRHLDFVFKGLPAADDDLDGLLDFQIANIQALLMLSITYSRCR
jgi:hypothetical protein